MTKTADQVKGVLTTNERPPLKIMTDPHHENKGLSYAQYVAKYDKIAKADAAAEAARKKVMGEELESPEIDSEADKDAKIKDLRGMLAAVEKKLKDDPTNKKLLKEKNKIAGDLDKAEDGE